MTCLPIALWNGCGSAHARRTTVSLVFPAVRLRRCSFQCSRTRRLDWSSVELFWRDERAVPADDPESNYRLADDAASVAACRIDRARVHRMPAELADLEARAAPIRRGNRARPWRDAALRRRACLASDLTATSARCFPDILRSRSRRGESSPVMDSPKPPPARLTLTLAAVEGADVFVAAFGAAKAAGRRRSAHRLPTRHFQSRGRRAPPGAPFFYSTRQRPASRPVST